MSYNKNRLTVVVPTKKERNGIETVIKSLKPYAKEIIIVDGHSNDGTKEIVERLNCRFYLDHGLGKGEGVRLGLSKSEGDVVLIFDADGSPDPKDIPRLVEPVFEGKADLVISSRRTGGSYDLNFGFGGVLRSAGADLFTTIVNYRFDTNFTDILYSFRAIKRSIVPKLYLKSNDFTIEQETIIKCLKSKFKIMEIPSRERARQWGKSKLKTITGFKMLLHLLKECYS